MWKVSCATWEVIELRVWMLALHSVRSDRQTRLSSPPLSRDTLNHGLVLLEFQAPCLICAQGITPGQLDQTHTHTRVCSVL